MTWPKLWNWLMQLSLSSYTPAFQCKNDMLCIAAVLRRMRNIWSRSIVWCQVQAKLKTKCSWAQPRSASPSQSVGVEWMLIILCHCNVVVYYTAITDWYSLSSSVSHWFPMLPSTLRSPQTLTVRQGQEWLMWVVHSFLITPSYKDSPATASTHSVSLPPTSLRKRKDSSWLEKGLVNSHNFLKMEKMQQGSER